MTEVEMGIEEDIARRRQEITQQQQAGRSAQRNRNEQSEQERAALNALAIQYRDWAMRHRVPPDFNYGPTWRRQRGWYLLHERDPDGGAWKTLQVKENGEVGAWNVGDAYSYVYSRVVDKIARSGHPWP